MSTSKKSASSHKEAMQGSFLPRSQSAYRVLFQAYFFRQAHLIQSVFFHQFTYSFRYDYIQIKIPLTLIIDILAPWEYNEKK